MFRTIAGFRKNANGGNRSWGYTALVLALAAVLAMAGIGFAKVVKTERSIQFDKPHVLNGLIINSDDSIPMDELADALEAIRPEPLQFAAANPAAKPAEPKPAEKPAAKPAEKPAAKPAEKPAEPKAAAKPADKPATKPAEKPAAKPAETKPAEKPAAKPAAKPAEKPAEAKPAAKPAPKPAPKPLPMSTLIALPKLSKLEVNEMSSQLELELSTKLGYAAVKNDVIQSPAAVPPGIDDDRVLARNVDSGTAILQYGYKYYVSQPPQLWVYGAILGQGAKINPNPDLATIEPDIKAMVASVDQMRKNLTVQDLDVKLVQLSYVDSKTAMAMLSNLGVTTMTKAAPAKVEYDKLPYVLEVPDPSKEYTGLIGQKTTAARSKLSLAPGTASDMPDNALSSPLTQLMVMFHPAHPEQFSHIRQLLDEYIDRPARQIFIEAMVLEISEEGLKELGVEWELNESELTVDAGATTADVGTHTLSVNVPNTSVMHRIFNGDMPWDWDMTIRALIREGKAEILSRPSILTLNNRQSTIRVGNDVPIASSLEGLTSSNRVSFSFEYLPIGILLNIRPRINEAGTEVSMLIDTIVSAKVPGEDLELRSSSDLVLASAPTVSTRRVQTYGRIANNTPLIIGGLVSRELVQTQDKIPLLGDLPVVGAAFRADKTETTKREVIIVLTPHVLPEQKVKQSYPKDEDHFDSFGNELFRDSYRIRSEDVFDLTFLLENRRIVSYRKMAREVAAKDYRLTEVEPFRSFVKDQIPGESILVTRMIYEVIKRLKVDDNIDPSKIIYFESQQVGGYNVKFLDDLVEDKDGKKVKFKDFGDKALAITYTYDRESTEEGHLGSEPIPDITMVDCPDRKTWSTKLWELNQPGADGKVRHTILIHDESDLTRLRRALALKKVETLNGGIDQMRLRNFSEGKVLMMPDLKKDQIHVVDADTAMFFFHTEHYYAATLAEVETRLKQLDTMLHRPDIKVLLDSDSELDSLEADGK